VVNKQTQAAAFKKRDPPAIGVVVGLSASLAKASEAERGICGGGAIETEQLAHGH
jgi:hypothetical protein